MVPLPCVWSLTQSPRSCWKGLGTLTCLFALEHQSLSPTDLPHPCSSVSDLRTGLEAKPEQGILTCLLGWLLLASVSFWTVPWSFAHLSSLWEAEFYRPPALLCESRLLGGRNPGMVPGSWLLSATPQPLLQSLGSRGRGRGCHPSPPSPGLASPACVVW